MEGIKNMHACHVTADLQILKGPVLTRQGNNFQTSTLLRVVC